MKEKQIIRAIPIYNDLHEVDREIRSLQLLRASLNGKAVLDIQMHVKKSLSIRVEGLEANFGLELIILIINHKKKIKEELEKKLDSV